MTATLTPALLGGNQLRLKADMGPAGLPCERSREQSLLRSLTLPTADVELQTGQGLAILRQGRFGERMPDDSPAKYVSLVLVLPVCEMAEAAPQSPPEQPVQRENVGPGKAHRVQIRGTGFQASADRLEQNGDDIRLEGNVLVAQTVKSGTEPVEIRAERVHLRLDNGRIHLQAISPVMGP